MFVRVVAAGADVKEGNIELRTPNIEWKRHLEGRATYVHHCLVKLETKLDRKAGVILSRTVTPWVAMIASFGACALGLWTFKVVFAGWQRDWALIPFFIDMFVAPALAFVSFRDLWCSGWNTLMFVAALASAAGFASWCAAVYFMINSHAD